MGMLKNCTIYKVTKPLDSWIPLLEDGIDQNALFKPLGKTQAATCGFVPIGEELAYHLSGCVWLRVKFHEKKIPAAAIAEIVDERKKRIEDGEDRKVYRKELLAMKDEEIAKLLPMTPPTPSWVNLCIDRVRQLVYVDTASPKKADDVIACLTVALSGCPVALAGVDKDPRLSFTNWLRSPALLKPHGWLLGDSCSLVDPADNAVANVAHDCLTGEEIEAHLDAGKICSRVSLVSEGLSFAVDKDLKLRTLKFDDKLYLEYDVDSDAAAADADRLICVDQIRKTIAALESLLGSFVQQSDLFDEEEEKHEDPEKGDPTLREETEAFYELHPDDQERALEFVEWAKGEERISGKKIRVRFGVGSDRAAKILAFLQAVKS